MKKMFQLQYDETEQMFIDMYQIFFNDRGKYVSKCVITFVGVLMLVIQVISNQTRIASITFWGIYILLWITAYGLGYIVDKYILKKINEQSAIQTGKEKYQLRVETCGNELGVMVDFYEDEFKVTFQGKTKEYSYKEVSRLLASETYYGLVVGGVYGKKEMVGFPSSAIDLKIKEALLQHLLVKCQNVPGGFRQR